MRKGQISRVALGAALLVSLAVAVTAYPPGVGVTSSSKDCLACHVNNGPWVDNDRLIVDIVDKETKVSLRQPDGTFLLPVSRGESRTVLTVLGIRSGATGDPAPPYRNGWTYVDLDQIATPTLSKFSPGWDVTLPFACRVVGDKWSADSSAQVTILPLTVQPTATALNDEVLLQAFLCAGESVKGDATKGLTGNYVERRLLLRVVDSAQSDAK